MNDESDPGAESTASGSATVDTAAPAETARSAEAARSRGADSEGPPVLAVAAALSFGAGFIHAVVIGQHIEHRQLAMLFLAAAVFQMGWAFVAVRWPSRLVAVVGVVGNLGAAAFWLATRLTSVGWIDGLDHKEAVGFTDAVSAALGLAAAVATVVALAPARPDRRRLPLMPAASAVAVIAIVAAVAGSWSPHSHAEGGAGHPHDETATGGGHDHDAGAGDHGHGSGEEMPPDRAKALAAAEEAGWPFKWDPDEPIDFREVPGTTDEQAEFADTLVESTLERLPRYADYRVAEADGYITIGDGGTGDEHFTKATLIDDGKNLDPSAPETIMYSVDRETGERTLSGAMFIAEQPEYKLGQAKLDSILGPLASWHVHQNVCFVPSADGGTKVVGIVDPAKPCPEGQFKASEKLPMVHVWVIPHDCGPFAALEGVGAGQTDESEAERIDACRHAESDHGP